MQDKELLKKLKKHPESGMKQLMTQYTGLVYTIIQGKLSDSRFCSADVEHCVADTFSEFYLDLKKYTPEQGSIKSWLCVIAKHNALDRLRKAYKEAGTLSLDDDFSGVRYADDFSIEEYLLTKEFKNELIKEIKALGEPDCEILIRKYYLSQSSKDIGTQLNMTVSAVDTRTHRAIEKLRNKLGGDRL